MAQIVIAVLTWRGYNATRTCLESLRRIAEWPVPTLVIDNSSGTGEGERLAREFGSPVEALTRSVNDGVPGGYNAAIAWAASRGAMHVLLLNNDVVIDDPRMLHKLVAATSEDVAVVGPTVLDQDGSVFSRGGTYDTLRGTTGHDVRQLNDPVATRDVAWVDGSCMLVSVRAAEAIGGLAPEFFMYCEETDWCLRAGRAGFRCVVVPAASIVHLRGTAVPSIRTASQLRRNAILLTRRNGSALQNLSALAYFLTVGLAREVRVGLGTGQGVRAVFSIATRAFGWNVADAVRRRRWRVPAIGPNVVPEGWGGRAHSDRDSTTARFTAACE